MRVESENNHWKINSICFVNMDDFISLSHQYLRQKRIKKSRMEALNR